MVAKRGAAIIAIASSFAALGCSGTRETQVTSATISPPRTSEATPSASPKLAPRAAPSTTGFSVGPRLNSAQTSYPALSLVAGISGGRILLGAQGDVPCGDWKMHSTTRGTTIDVRSFEGPPQRARCYGAATALWEAISVPNGGTQIVLRYRNEMATYAIDSRGGDLRVGRVSGTDVARIPADGRWWTVPEHFLYARARDGRGAEGSAERACARIAELVRERGGERFVVPVGLPLPRLDSADDAPGTRAEAGATMLSDIRDCGDTYVLRASDEELRVMANDAACEGAIASFVRRIPDGAPISVDPERATCGGSDSPLGLG